MYVNIQPLTTSVLASSFLVFFCHLFCTAQVFTGQMPFLFPEGHLARKKSVPLISKGSCTDQVEEETEVKPRFTWKKAVKMAVLVDFLLPISISG